MNKNNEVFEINVKDLFFTILRKFWIIVIFGMLGVGIAGAVSKYLIEPIYSSTARVYIINRQDTTRMTLSDLQSGAQLTKDYMILVKSRPVLEQVIQELDMNIAQEELAGRITVNTPEDTRILEITVNDTEAAMAKLLADTIARVSSERMVSIMDMEQVNVVEQGNFPLYPSSPDTAHDIILGGLVGGILATFVIFLSYVTNDAIKSSDDIGKYLGMSTLSCIPMEEDTDRKKEKSNKKEAKKDRKITDLAS